MAKRSKIARNEQRKRIVARYAERRAELISHEGYLPGLRKSSW
jgi:ribosomal protein S14